MSRKLKKKRPSIFKKSKPVDVKAVFNAAYASHQGGNLDQAKSGYKRVLHAAPKHTDALNLLAAVQQQTGKFQQAVKLLKKAISLCPDRADYYTNLGSAFRGTEQFTEAIRAFKKALTLHPGHFEAQFNLADTLLKQGDWKGAAAGFEKIIKFKPTIIAAREKLARVLELQGKLPEALQSLTAITEIFPENAAAYNNIGNILVQQGEIHNSLEMYQKAITLNPDLSEAYVNLSWAYKEHGMLQEDVACLRQYLARHPEDAQSHSDLLFSLNYDPAYSCQQLFAEARQWWDRHGMVHSPSFPRQAEKNDNKKLRIGFLSPDLRQHPVGSFILPLIKNLNPEQITVHCYVEMTPNQEDAISEQIKKLSASWIRIAGLSTEDAVEKITHDKIDILIDLAGHSANNRLDVMVCRPAPVQISWLGYVNTTGLNSIDYRITDWQADPMVSCDSTKDADVYYSEKLLRMPNAFFCYEAPPDTPPVGPLPALHNAHITFGSLNNIAKITDEVIALWAEIMLGTEKSQLIIVARQFNDIFIKNRYMKKFTEQGVASERLQLVSNLPMQEYLALYDKIDIALDPFPHNGHTITCHTLWMGVPIVALRGDRYAARMGVSVLSAANLAELIAENPAEYVAKNISLAHDIKKLASLRTDMREQLQDSPMCDCQTFAADFTTLLREISGYSEA